jgi:hypothetical protein
MSAQQSDGDTARVAMDVNVSVVAAASIRVSADSADEHDDDDDPNDVPADVLCSCVIVPTRSSAAPVSAFIQQCLFTNGTFGPIDLDEFGAFATRFAASEQERAAAELDQESARFGKRVKWFSSKEKSEFDAVISALQARRARGETHTVTVLSNLYATGNAIAPWSYVFLLLDSAKSDYRVGIYFIETISFRAFEDCFEVDLGVKQRKLTYFEASSLCSEVCVLDSGPDPLVID